MTDVEKFEKQNYLILREAYPQLLVDILSDAISINFYSRPDNFVKDAQSPKSHALGNTNLMLSILRSNQGLLEEKTGLELYPTYAYMRIYRPGDILEPHTDRPACEISSTLTLNYRCENLWPFFVDNGDGERKVEMDSGDMVVYRGNDVVHWRDRFEAERRDWWMQIFLHYVDKNGPHADHAYDKKVQTEEKFKYLDYVG